MTHIRPACLHGTNANTSSPRRGAVNGSRRHGVQLSYDGVTAAYIRDISRRPGSGTRRRFVPEPGPTQPYLDELAAAGIR
jgi:hypothetical protein